jgi:hypothetical protein
MIVSLPLSQLLPKLHAVFLPLRINLLVAQGRFEAVYFVESGWASIVLN